MDEIIRTPNEWSGDDTNLANTYLNIANVLSVVQQWMKSHVNNVKNGNGIITLGDIQEALKFLEDSVNNRLSGLKGVEGNDISHPMKLNIINP